MTSLEDRLRDAYRAVTDMVREEDLPGPDEQRARTRRRNRFSAFAPLAAAAAVVVAIVVGLVVPGLLNASGHPTAPTAIPATSKTTPPFMIIAKNAECPAAAARACFKS